MIQDARWITACIPTFGCTRYLREAVLSLLNQSYPYIRLIVINDGDPNKPWSVLDSVDDCRLLRFDLKDNRGPYFAHAIAAAATPDPLFLVQDADDWSAPERVATLLHLLDRDHASYAFSTLSQFREDCDANVLLEKPLFSRIPQLVPGPEFRLRMPHHGLFRTAALSALGGYFGGFPFGYDELLTNMLLMVGSASWTPERLYWRRLRQASLTRDPETGMFSKRRRQLRAEMSELHVAAYQDYQAFVGRRISGAELLRLLRTRIEQRRGVDDSSAIQRHASSLRQAMTAQFRLAAG